MKARAHDLAERVLAGDRRAGARLITQIENQDPLAALALEELYPATGRAYLVGLTGPPGAGKSTLVDHLVAAIRQEGRTVGVIAVDPSSPISGGAILGDRVRMKQHAGDAGVFIRSMSNRGQLGGIALATRSACVVLDALGCEVILIETVGVGQSEVAIAKTADTTVLVMPPNLGDGIQAIKAGIMEVPDVFVVNKADLPGAAQAVAEIRTMLEEGDDLGWRPPVLETRSLLDLPTSGVPELWQHLQVHRDFLRRTALLAVRRQQQARAEIEQAARARLERALAGLLERRDFEDLAVQVRQRVMSPMQAAAKLLDDLRL